MDALAIFLLVVVVLISFITLVVNVYILVYFSHPEDNASRGIWIYRGLVIACMSFASYLVFAIPLDIANAVRDDSVNLGYNMDMFWWLLFLAIAFCLILLLPGALLLYADDDDVDFKTKVFGVLKGMGMSLGGHLVFILLYHFLIKET
jgi:hypothetical protein